MISTTCSRNELSDIVRQIVSKIVKGYEVILTTSFYMKRIGRDLNNKIKAYFQNLLQDTVRKILIGPERKHLEICFIV